MLILLTEELVATDRTTFAKSAAADSQLFAAINELTKAVDDVDSGSPSPESSATTEPVIISAELRGFPRSFIASAASASDRAEPGIRVRPPMARFCARIDGAARGRQSFNESCPGTRSVFSKHQYFGSLAQLLGPPV